MGARQRSWCSAAVLAALVAASGATPAMAAAGTVKTTIESVYPWAADGQLKAGLEVAGTVKGNCWTSSIAVSSSDAYRCMTTKSFVHDPCFAPDSKTFAQLACMTTPWSKVTRFDLTAPIPKAAMHPSRLPWVWAYQLGNRVRCTTETGTGTMVDKVALNYYCVPGTGWASIPDKSAEPWTVRYAKSYKAKTLETEKVSIAWY